MIGFGKTKDVIAQPPNSVQREEPMSFVINYYTWDTCRRERAREPQWYIDGEVDAPFFSRIRTKRGAR